MHELVRADSDRLDRAPDQPIQALVRVRLAEQVGGLAVEDSLGRLRTVLRGQEVAEAREDDPMHRLILRRTITAEPVIPPSALSSKVVAWIRERHGPGGPTGLQNR